MSIGYKGERIEVTSNISEEANGYAKCNLCNSLWCEHVREYILQADDAYYLWTDAVHNTALGIMVPLIPSHNQWGQANILFTVEGGREFAKVDLAIERAGTEETFHLGYIHPGEARLSLRYMIADWFRGTVDGRELSCQSTYHGFSQSAKLREDAKSEVTIFPQLWSMYTVGTCLSCTYSTSEADIPEDEPRKKIW